MFKANSTTEACNDNLAGLDPRAVELVLRTVERVTHERSLEDVIHKLRAGNGAGLLAADAMREAVRHLGAWGAIERAQSFLLDVAMDTPATEVTCWAQERIATIRSKRLGIDIEDETLAEKLRIDCQDEAYSRLDASTCWLERSLLHLCEFAIWAAWTERNDAYRPESSLERAADDAGMEVASILANAPRGVSVAWEFVRHLRGTDPQAQARAA